MQDPYISGTEGPTDGGLTVSVHTRETESLGCPVPQQKLYRGDSPAQKM